MPTPIKINNKIEYVAFEIEGTVCEVPIASSLMPQELEKLTTQEALTEFFKKHIGAELWESLNIGARNQIAQVWSDESSNKSGGASVGKSSASPKS